MSQPSPQQLQAQFVQQVAQQTGIDPRVVEQWATREGAYAANGTGGLNFLNLRPYKSDQGVASVSPGGFDRFANLDDAVASTVTRIGQPFLQQYLAPALGKGPEAQWNAITQSGWSSDHYGHQALGDTAAPAVPPAALMDAAGAASAPPGGAAPTAGPSRAMLASFLIGNLQQHARPSAATLVPELAQIKQAQASTPPVATAAQGPSSAATPATQDGPTGSGLTIARAAMTQLGTPYQYGGPAELGAHTDCSGLLQAAARAAGVKIPRRTYEQWNAGTEVDPNQLQPGDGVFFHMTSQGPSHVGIYIGGGQFVEDPHTGAQVKIEKLANYPGFVGARRFT